MLLITNDDGIEAPGIAALVQAVEAIGEPWIVVAPAHPMSECSHCVTTKRALSVTETQVGLFHAATRYPGKRFAVGGTPADCVRVAILHILPGLGFSEEQIAREIFALSGINAGGNLGADVYISGTVAAVREAAFFGLPGLAISQYRRGDMQPHQWTTATVVAQKVIISLRHQALAPGEFWNVNLPWHVPDPNEVQLAHCERSRRPLPVKYEQVDAGLHYVAGRYHGRAYEAGSDIEACFNNHIAITREKI